MRLRVLTLVIAGVLASAGAAAAQAIGANGAYEGSPGAPGQDGPIIQSTGGSGEVGSRHARYLWRLQSLREWAFKLKAQDGGELSAQHIAMLERQLDKLIRIYGKG